MVIGGWVLGRGGNPKSIPKVIIFRLFLDLNSLRILDHVLSPKSFKNDTQILRFSSIFRNYSKKGDLEQTPLFAMNPRIPPSWTYQLFRRKCVRFCKFSYIGFWHPFNHFLRPFWLPKWIKKWSKFDQKSIDRLGCSPKPPRPPIWRQNWPILGAFGRPGTLPGGLFEARDPPQRPQRYPIASPKNPQGPPDAPQAPQRDSKRS